MSCLSRKFFVSLTLLLLVTSLTGAGCTQPVSGQAISNLTIIHTNDLEGALKPCSCISDPAGGVARRKSAIEQIRAQDEPVILTDAGNSLFGFPESNITHGQAMVMAMNQMGYDAMALGDRDFIYGADILQEAIQQIEFPVLSANIVWAENGQPFTQASTIIERGGIRIGLLGLTHPGVRTLLAKDPGLGSKLRVTDPIAAARKQITKLLSEVDFVIVLSNLGETRDRQLASKVNGIGAIISGFDRKIIDPPEILLNGVPRVQVGYQGELLGVMNMAVLDNHRAGNLTTANVSLGHDVPTDPKLAFLLAHYNARAALSGMADAMPGLDVTFPLEIHRANPEVQAAYQVAVAFPEVLMKQPAPPNLPELKTLANCFILNPADPNFAFQYTFAALEHPECIQHLNTIIPNLPLLKMPAQIDLQYAPGD